MKMKKLIISAILVLCTVMAFAQTNDADRILGTYLSENKTGKVEVTKQNGKYIGTLVWTSIEGAKMKESGCRPKDENSEGNSHPERHDLRQRHLEERHHL